MKTKKSVKMAATTALALAITTANAFAAPALKTCSANRDYCSEWAKKKAWAHPQCAEAFDRCMHSGEWQTGGPHGRSVHNVERR